MTGRYTVVESTDIGSLAGAVEGLIEEGWVPLTFSVQVGYSESETMYRQALWRPRPGDDWRGEERRREEKLRQLREQQLVDLEELGKARLELESSSAPARRRRPWWRRLLRR